MFEYLFEKVSSTSVKITFRVKNYKFKPQIRTNSIDKNNHGRHQPILVATKRIHTFFFLKSQQCNSHNLTSLNHISKF